jgi:Protein of unknown function (DUF2937)
MNVLYRYLLIIIAGAALLIGIQLPNLADQYEKRVDAHWREVAKNLLPFQEIADKYFGGSLAKLIELHRTSEARPFQEEGLAIEAMVKRKLRFEDDLAALKVSLPEKIAHILLVGDREMMGETLAQYTYAVPLNQDAVITGAALAAVILLLLELLLAFVRYVTVTIMRKLLRPATKME